MKPLFIGAYALALIATGPALAGASPMPQGRLHNPAWDYAHLRPDGVAKCHAFQAIFRQTTKLQKGDDGTLPVEWRRQLQAKLAAAKSKPPKSVTPATCGVPL